MIKLAPKESQAHTLPQPSSELILSNETMASVDLDIEMNDNTLKVIIKGLYLGQTQEAPFENTKKHWKLS